MSNLTEWRNYLLTLLLIIGSSAIGMLLLDEKDKRPDPEAGAH
jgi:hypothetical protein